MTWKCPECGKSFRNPNQEHSCARLTVEEHLRNRSGAVRMIFDRLMMEAHRFGDITVNPVKTSIKVKAGATFLSIMLKKDRVDVEFFLDREVSKPPIVKSFRVSGRRVLHCATLENFAAVNQELVGWLKESYELVAGR